MKVITAVKKYLDTDREIFLQSVNDIGIYAVDKNKDFRLHFGSRIADTKVKQIDIEESPDAVTIYI